MTSPSILVLTVARRVETELNAALGPLDLTVRKLGLLGHIASVPGASFSDLARISGITVQTVHSSVKTLTSSGLARDCIARAGSSSTIEVTPKGARLLASAKEAIAELDERLFGDSADPALRQVGQAVVAAMRDQGGN